MTVAINKDGHARIIIMRPETILHERPNTFSQTASRSIDTDKMSDMRRRALVLIDSLTQDSRRE